MKRVGKSVISVYKKAERGYKMHFIAVRKSTTRSGFVIHSDLKDSALQRLKRMKQGMQKG